LLARALAQTQARPLTRSDSSSLARSDYGALGLPRARALARSLGLPARLLARSDFPRACSLARTSRALARSLGQARSCARMFGPSRSRGRSRGTLPRSVSRYRSMVHPCAASGREAIDLRRSARASALLGRLSPCLSLATKVWFIRMLRLERAKMHTASLLTHGGVTQALGHLAKCARARGSAAGADRGNVA